MTAHQGNDGQATLAPAPTPMLDRFSHSAHVLNGLSGPACIVAASGLVTYLNEAWQRLAGLSQTPAALQLSTLVGARAYTDFISAMLGASQPYFESQIGPASNPRWFLFQTHRQELGPGQQVYFLCIGIDVDARVVREGHMRGMISLQENMLSGSVDCIKAISKDGTLLHMNLAGCKALGVDPDNYAGRSWLPLLPIEVQEAGRKALARAQQGQTARFPGRSQLAGKPTQYWDNLLSPVFGAGDRLEYILCISREVTRQKLAEDASTRGKERLEMAAKIGGLGIWDYDVSADVLICDATWHQIMGLSPDQPVTTIDAFREIIHPDDRERATEVNQTAQALLASSSDYSIVYRVLHSSGTVRWVRSAASIEYADAIPTRAVGFLVDITDAWNSEVELRERNRSLEAERIELTRQSQEDYLTGIGNRRFFEAAVQVALATSPAPSTTRCFGIVDVDFFKAFNDHYGHLSGDLALKRIAHALHEAIQRIGIVARIGGEEFAFFIEDAAATDHCLHALIEAVKRLGIRHDASPKQILSISCGAVILGSHISLDYAELFRHADEALYAAKLSGKGRYVLTELQSEVPREEA